MDYVVITTNKQQSRDEDQIDELKERLWHLTIHARRQKDQIQDSKNELSQEKKIAREQLLESDPLTSKKAIERYIGKSGGSQNVGRMEGLLSRGRRLNGGWTTLET